MMDVEIGQSFGPNATTNGHPPIDLGAAAIGAPPYAASYSPLLSSTPQPFSPHVDSSREHETVPAPRKMRKRKAETQDNERLNKRFSLLNLEKNGQKLYVPVETPQLAATPSSALEPIPDQEQEMRLDDSKHKVYIYDLDAELSDSDDAGSDDGRLVFLPDIEKHLRLNRIPPSVLANKDGELAGMQMVLYNEPKSLSVPEGQDSVRKAILEARSRLREKQNSHSNGGAVPHGTRQDDAGRMEIESRRVPNGLNNLANDVRQPPSHVVTNGVPSSSASWTLTNDDPDAMDMD
ncbi:hypothetical protein BX600DRAFT_506091 [Xylariales sp. PMI_506]|nr:hypothetical protein BX600DRAFT_506091 [Xylariales sp. PMI_506]